MRKKWSDEEWKRADEETKDLTMEQAEELGKRCGIRFLTHPEDRDKEEMVWVIKLDVPPQKFFKELATLKKEKGIRST